jgi:hypothetical protein
MRNKFYNEDMDDDEQRTYGDTYIIINNPYRIVSYNIIMVRYYDDGSPSRYGCK